MRTLEIDADRARALKKAALNTHPEKRGSSDSRNYLRNYINRRENRTVNTKDEFKLLIHDNSDKNQCGQLVFAQLSRWQLSYVIYESNRHAR